MKIGDPGFFSISVRPGRGISSIFDGLNIGDRISAKVVKSDGNTALLQFRGRSFTADFLSGLPPGESVDLVLSEKTPDRIAFTLAFKNSPDEFVKLLNMLSVVPEHGPGEIPLHNLMKFLGNGRVDLLSLNLFLAGIKKDSKEGKSTRDIFNSLLAKGIPFSSLTDLSIILAGRGGEVILAAWYFMLKNVNQGGRRWREDEAGEIADNIIDSLSGDDEAIDEILGFLRGKDGDYVHGEIPFPDGEKFSRMEYIYKDSSYFFDMEFSALGRVSATVKSDKTGSHICIFHENDDIISFMKGRLDILLKNLELTGVKKPDIKFHNSKKMIDKLDIWRTDFYIKRGFDVRF